MGTRLRSAVSDLPKCLAPVAGRPLLHYMIEHLEAAGFSHVILSLGYMHEKVEEWLGSLKTGMRISTAVESEPLGTGGGVKLALTRASSENVFILNGDTWFDVPLHTMLKAHEASGCTATLALKKMRDFDRYGAVEVEKGRISAFREKCRCSGGLISGGVYIIRKDALEGLPDAFSMEKDFFEKMVAQGALAAFESDGFFLDIGIPEDYRSAQRIFAEGLYKRYDTLFLDRDGVINRELTGTYVRNPQEFEFLPGVKEALRRLRPLFARMTVITNQRGVTKGIMTLQDLEVVHGYMLDEIEKAGGHIDAVYFSTGMDCSDPMRKPNPGMVLKAVAERPQTDLARSFMAGDKDTDMECAANAGVKGIRISPDFTLNDFADQLLGQ